MGDEEPFRPPLNPDGLRVAHEMVEERKRLRALDMDIPASARIVAEHEAKSGRDAASALGRAIAVQTQATLQLASAWTAFSFETTRRVQEAHTLFWKSLIPNIAPVSDKKRRS